MQNTWLENRIIKKLAKFLLPAVTAEDSGKTAVVDSSGAWSVGESGGGENDASLLITYTYNEGVFSCDKTPSEILTAINNKKQILACFGENAPVQAPHVDTLASENEITDVRILILQYGIEDVAGSPTNLNIAAYLFKHNVESGNVTLQSAGEFNISPAE